MNTPLISFIVPAYNVAPYIKACLDSIYNLDMKGYEREVILVNDGSTDDTVRILEEYERQHKGMLVASQPNGGPAVARNNAMAMASGKYLCFVDADDSVCAQAELPLSELETADVDMYGLDIERVTVNGERRNYYRFKAERGKLWTPALAFQKDRNMLGCCWAYLFRTEYLRLHGIRFVPGLYNEDELFVAEAFIEAVSFMALNTKWYLYHEREDSLTTTIDNAKTEWRIRDIIEILRMLDARAGESPRIRECLQHKLDYLAVDSLQLLLRYRHGKKFREAMISKLREIGYFPLHWRWNIKYIGFNILTRYIFRQ